MLRSLDCVFEPERHDHTAIGERSSLLFTAKSRNILNDDTAGTEATFEDLISIGIDSKLSQTRMSLTHRSAVMVQSQKATVAARLTYDG